MARVVHQSIWTSEQFGRLNERQQLLFIGLITIADDQGRFRAYPASLRITIFPFNKRVTDTEIRKDLEKMDELGLIYLYEFDGSNYGYFPKWTVHQKLRSDRVKDSRIPLPSAGKPVSEGKNTRPQPSGNQMATKWQPPGAEVSKEVSKKVIAEKRHSEIKNATRRENAPPEQTSKK